MFTNFPCITPTLAAPIAAAERDSLSALEKFQWRLRVVSGRSMTDRYRPKAVVALYSKVVVSRHGYWITSSARSSSSFGIVSPRARAVLRLIAKSNFVGC
jgi:hypothetical protein